MAGGNDDIATGETLALPASAATLPLRSSTGTADGAAPLPDEPFRRADPAEWQVGGEIAHGGMGRVVRARDLKLQREVALKEVLSPTPGQVERFEREIRLTARLQHPAIVTIHSAGRWPDGRRFYEMKLLTGRPLDQVIGETRNLHDRLALLPRMLTVVEALAYAHDQRIIHRDLKPSNVLCGEFGETVVIDWGLAKDLRDRTSPEPSTTSSAPSHPASSALPSGTALRSVQATVDGAVMGTPSYMSPEQARGKKVDERSDVYALGAMLYHVLCGAPPYVANTAGEVIAAVHAGPPVPLGRRVPDASPALVAIVTRAMGREPESRYPTAAQMADDLRRFLAGQLVGSYRYTTWQLFKRWAWRNRAVLLASLTAVVGAAAVGAITLRRMWRAETEKRQAAELVAQKDSADHAAYLLSLQGQALQALNDGQIMEAAPYLVPVYAEQKGDPGVRYMVARSLATVEPLDLTLAGHNGNVNAAAWSPDGTRVVTASDDDTARVWDASSGRLLFTLAGHTQPLWSASFSPDGSHIATASSDGTARLWDARTGQALATFTGHTGEVHVAVFSPDGARLLTTSKDGTARLWDAGTGAPIVAWTADPPSVWPGAFSPDGTRIATGGSDNLVKLWDARTQTLELTLGPDTLAVWTAAFSPDGKTLVSAGESRTPHLWDTTTGRLLRSLPVDPNAVAQVSFCGGGARILTASWDQTAKLWDAASGAELAVFEGHASMVDSAECDATGTRLVTASFDRTARVWNVPGSARLPILSVAPSGAVSIAYSHDNGRLAIGGTDGTARVFDVATGALLLSAPVDDQPIINLAFTSDGARLMTQSEHLVRLSDARTGALLTVMRPPDNDSIYNATLDADGARVLTTGSKGAATLYDTATGGEILPLAAPAVSLMSGAFSPDGTCVAVGDADGGIRLFDATTGAVIGDLPRGSGQILGLGFSPDGRHLAAAGGTKDGHIWDVATRTLVASLIGNSTAINSLSYNADGTLILVVSQGGQARVFSGSDGRQLGLVDRSPATIEQAAFSPDGKTIATIDLTGNARLWDAHLEDRTPDVVADLVAQRVPYQVEGGTLVPTGPASGPAP
jgi:WD40 repeat protein/serine/threonine protein kinase